MEYSAEQYYRQYLTYVRDLLSVRRSIYIVNTILRTLHIDNDIDRLNATQYYDQSNYGNE